MNLTIDDQFLGDNDCNCKSLDPPKQRNWVSHPEYHIDCATFLTQCKSCNTIFCQVCGGRK